MPKWMIIYYIFSCIHIALKNNIYSILYIVIRMKFNLNIYSEEGDIISSKD